MTAASALARLLVAARLPLFPDETYYWEWSRRLAAGYFDHPPVIALLIRGGTMLLGATPIGVRLFPQVAGALAVWFIVLLARDIAGARAAAWAALVAASLPVVSLGLVLATPDAPLVLFLALTLLAVVRAASNPPGNRDSLRWWLVAGISSGLACDAKYSALIVPAAVLLALASRRELRPHLKSWAPYAGVLLMGALVAPVVWWNDRHGWISFRFQLGHGFGGHPAPGLVAVANVLERELTLIAGAAVAASPLLLALGAATAWRATQKPASPAERLLATVSLMWFAVFVLSATRHGVEVNWLAPAFLGLVPLLGASVVSAGALAPATRRRLGAACGVGLALGAAAYAFALRPVAAVPASRDPVARAMGWSGAAARIAAVVDSLQRSPGRHGSRVWIAANTYQDASEIDFGLPRHTGVLALNVLSRANQYDLWPSFARQARPGDALLLVLPADAGGATIRDVVAREFTSVEDGGAIDLRRTGAGDLIARRRAWICEGWRGSAATSAVPAAGMASFAPADGNRLPGLTPRPPDREAESTPHRRFTGSSAARTEGAASRSSSRRPG